MRRVEVLFSILVQYIIHICCHLQEGPQWCSRFPQADQPRDGTLSPDRVKNFHFLIMIQTGLRPTLPPANGYWGLFLGG